MVGLHPSAGNTLHSWLIDGRTLAIVLLARFIGGLGSALTGLAMGMVLNCIWLHILAPVETTPLIVGYGLITQSYAIWKLRHALSSWSVAPFIIGGTVGVPVGTMLLTY